MIFEGHIVMTMRSGDTPTHIPAHVDVLSGAGRPSGTVDRGGSIDRVLNRYAEGHRTAGVFSARKSLGRPAEQHVAFDEIEEQLGLSRTYKIQIGNKQKAQDVVKALRDLQKVESAREQTLATAPLATLAPVLRPRRASDAWAPHERIFAREAHEIEPGDERVTTSIVDTGIIIGHPEFQRRCLAGYDTVDIGIGRLNDHMRLVGDSRGPDYNPHDDVGHGCQVAGIIGAQGWEIPPGVGGLTLLLPLRVLAAAVPDGGTHRVGVGALADIDAGLKIAVDLGAVVINMSFGTPQNSVDPDAPPPHDAVIKYAVHYGCILIAAAGNTGQKEAFYPAKLPEVIAVGSVGLDGRRSSFSSWGDHLTLCAPGEDVISSNVRGYKRNSGTSFAAPFVTGVVALLVSRARRKSHKLTWREAKDILIRSADPLGGGGFHPETGHGFLNARAALRELDHYLERAA